MAVFVAKSALDARWTGRHRIGKAFPGQNVPRDDHGRWTDNDSGPMSDDEWQNLLADTKDRSKRADTMLAEIMAAPNQSAVLTRGNEKILISRSLDANYQLRATHIDERGPSGHTEFKAGDTRGLKDEIFRALAGGYKLTTMKAIAKAGPDDIAELERLLRQSDQLTAQVRQAFLDAVQRIGDRIDVDALRALLENGRIGEAMQVVNAQSVTQGYGPLIDAITAGTITAARSSALANMTAGAEFSFSQTNPEAIGFLRDYEMNLIRELTADALASVRAVITDGVTAGRHPFAIASDVRDFIGLTERQTRAVMNYRRALEQGDGDALARQLRDRRFDPSVRRAVRGDRALSADQIDTMVERYRQRYLRYRSETIARTEAKRSLGAGNQLLWEQAVADGKVDADQVTKKWTTVGDHKVRSSHVALNGQVVGLNESFQSPEGPIRYPGDPAAPGSMTINCRCTPIFRFKLKATEE